MKVKSKLILGMCLCAMIVILLGCEKSEVVVDDYLYKILIPKNLTGSEKGLPLKNRISANMISIDNEEEQIERKDEFNYEPYLHKIWIPESWKGTDSGVSYDDTISFYISNIDGGYIEGKVTEGGSIEPGDGAPRFSGEVKNGIAKCHFQNDYGNEGEMELAFNNEDEIQVTLTYIKLNNPEKIEKIKAGSIYKPYNLEDKKDTVTVISEVKININSWGNVKLVVGRFDTTRAFYGVAYLTNEEGDILYRFQAPFRTGAWIEEGYVEDINGDGLLDVRLIERFDADDIEDAEWIFLQEEDGLFSDGELVYEEDKMSN